MNKNWTKEELNVLSDKFNKSSYQQYRDYLIGLSQAASVDLTKDEQYDRIRFLREIAGMDHSAKMQIRSENKPISERYNSSFKR